MRRIRKHAALLHLYTVLINKNKFLVNLFVLKWKNLTKCLVNKV
jgi:hypothetical protein